MLVWSGLAKVAELQATGYEFDLHWDHCFSSLMALGKLLATSCTLQKVNGYLLPRK